MPRDSRVYTVLQPAVQWGWQEIFLNKTVFLLETLVWMKTKDAQKKIPQHRPTPFMPDFMPQRSAPGMINNGIEAHTTDDVREILARKRG